MNLIFGLPFHEVIIPVLSWLLISLQYIYLIYKGAYKINQSPSSSSSSSFFYNNNNNNNNKEEENENENENENSNENKKKFKVYPLSFFHFARVGWVHQNYLTGQAAANSTRDYLRVILFFAGNAAVLGVLVVGYTVNGYKRNGDAYDHLKTFQMGFLSFLLFLIFYLFLYSTRFALHFHFLMNVKYIEGNIPMPLSVISQVFEKSYDYYVAGARMYLVLVPMFAWLVSSWCLLVITLPHMYVVYRYDNLDWLETEVEEMYSAYQPLLSEEKQTEISSINSNGKKNNLHQSNENIKSQQNNIKNDKQNNDIEKGLELNKQIK